MSDEKEPIEHDAFFKQALDRLKSLGSLLAEKRIKRNETPMAKILEWRGDIARAQRVRNFIDSPFWTEDLEPFLRGEAALKPWSLGDQVNTDEIANVHLFNSGKVWVLKRMLNQFEKWLKMGDEAQHALAAEEKNKTLTR